MASEELLEDLCHFTAERGRGLSYIEDLSCFPGWRGCPDRNVNHTDDAFLLFYRTERELGCG